MAAKNFEEWVPFLNDILAFWDENTLPQVDAIIINGVEVTRADVLAMRDSFMAYDPNIKRVERELERLQDKRVADSAKINKFGVNFRAAMVGRFGADSDAARNTPVVSERRGSGGKAADKEKAVSAKTP